MAPPQKRKTSPSSDTLPAVAPVSLPSASEAVPTPTNNWVKETNERIQRTFDELEKRKGQEEVARVYQLALWPDDKCAMPSDFIACALFTSLQGKDSAYVELQQIASINDFTVIFTGRRLTQVHADVWQAIMHLARKLPEGSVVRFRARDLLRFMGRQTGLKQRKDLHRWISQLTATAVEIGDVKNKRRFRGSLLPRSADGEHDDDTLYCVEISRDLAKVLNSGFGLVDWEQRRQLQRKPLALWLQIYFSKFTKLVAVAELHRLSGSTASLRRFRQHLHEALAELEQVGVVTTWRIDDKVDVVHITLPGAAAALPPAQPEQRALPAASQGKLSLAVLPAVSPRVKDNFRMLYPDLDADRCFADWCTWLAKTGRTAEHPDAAFLGFAKRWASTHVRETLSHRG